jgi:hypothetical protein
MLAKPYYDVNGVKRISHVDFTVKPGDPWTPKALRLLESFGCTFFNGDRPSSAVIDRTYYVSYSYLDPGEPSKTMLLGKGAGDMTAQQFCRMFGDGPAEQLALFEIVGQHNPVAE